ncbi:MAG: hypothetical protein BSR46_04730 [Candidatus Dactylopiibacterium carminicum]|nr:alpha/beta hydrolase [Candidatus Dactylopiibacterium carminicum]PAT00048.1 MAG: hypothetical protein BSR46_04730 [Candidatus Dactylopiibacterium carminicum]
MSFLRTRCLLGCALASWLLSGVAMATPLLAHEEIPLWGAAVPPGSEALTVTEQLVNRSGDPQRPERVFSGITRPSLSAFLPAKPNGVALIVAPGGGYTRLAFDKEGVAVAQWLTAKGFSVFVLKYRLPDEGHRAGRLVPLQDGQRAVRLLRSQAEKWHIDPQRIGIMGFSAGGHLAAATGLDFARPSYAPVDAIDGLSARPDFVALIYAAAAFRAQPADAGGRPESSLAYSASGTLDRVSRNAPPTFILIAGDDARVPPESNVALWQALHQAGVAAELHVALRGGHGFGLLENASESVRSWPASFETWLRAIGMNP